MIIERLLTDTVSGPGGDDADDACRPQHGGQTAECLRDDD